MDTCKRMWSKNEIENMAAGGTVYRHSVTFEGSNAQVIKVIFSSSNSAAYTLDTLKAYIDEQGEIDAVGYVSSENEPHGGLLRKSDTTYKFDYDVYNKSIEDFYNDVVKAI